MNRCTSLSSDIKIAVDREVHPVLSRHQQKHPEVNIGSLMICGNKNYQFVIMLVSAMFVNDDDINRYFSVNGHHGYHCITILPIATVDSDVLY
jgi:hypothetical protein